MIVCDATVKVEVEKDALPPLTVPLPRVVDPSLNVTVPVGVPEPEGVMVAVNFTACPNCDGLFEEVTTVLVEASMTCLSADDVLPVK